MDKEEALLEALRQTAVGNEIIIHNSDGSIYAILLVVAKEHTHENDEG